MGTGLMGCVAAGFRGWGLLEGPLGRKVGQEQPLMRLKVEIILLLPYSPIDDCPFVKLQEGGALSPDC